MQCSGNKAYSNSEGAHLSAYEVLGKKNDEVIAKMSNSFSVGRRSEARLVCKLVMTVLLSVCPIARGSVSTGYRAEGHFINYC